MADEQWHTDDGTWYLENRRTGCNRELMTKGDEILSPHRCKEKYIGTNDQLKPIKNQLSYGK